MEPVKDTLTLVRAFLRLVNTDANAGTRLRLAIIGDGMLREEAERLLHSADAANLAWFAGERNDVPEIMRGLDLFVLPSLREGISNTILEAMASGLPVLATRVGGNPELIEHGETGLLVPPADPLAMAEAMRTYLAEPGQLIRHGQAGRKRAEKEFSVKSMVDGYLAVYDSVLQGQKRPLPHLRSTTPNTSQNSL
jgi:glycosyltransferase involved in cell wall biosynthesis